MIKHLRERYKVLNNLFIFITYCGYLDMLLDYNNSENCLYILNKSN